MENRKYVVSRNDIYVGEVIRTSCIYLQDDEYDFFNTKQNQLTTGTWASYRSILFVPNEDKLSNDLLYNSPNYPILNVTDNETCLNLGEDSIVIKNAYNLAVLLEYFGYNEDLTYEDIMKIRKTFFTAGFAKDNCHLFGLKEITTEDLDFFTVAGEVIDPKELERSRRRFRLRQLMGHRMFKGASECPLPKEYWYVLNERGDNSLMQIIEGWEKRINAFAPHKQEGPIKSLRRF